MTDPLAAATPTPPGDAFDSDVFIKGYFYDRVVAERSSAPPAATVEQEAREIVAFQLMLYEMDHDGDWPAEKVRGALGEAGSAHSGDCTKQPWTCMRCVCDDVYKRADAIIAALSKQPAQGGRAIELLGEKLMALSDRLQRIGAFNSDNVHAAYEAVVAAFQRLCPPDDGEAPSHAD